MTTDNWVGLTSADTVLTKLSVRRNWDRDSLRQ